jgi:Lipid A core - O-antigen ligase and related enzymes
MVLSTKIKTSKITGGIILPVFLLTMLCIVLLFDGLSLTDSFLLFKNTQTYKIIISVLTILPALFVVFSQTLRSETWQKKLLFFGIAFIVVNLMFSNRAFINSSYVFYVFTLIYFFKERKFEKFNLLFWLLTAYFAWHCVSLLWTINISEGVKQLFDSYLPFLLFPLMFSMFSLTKKEVYLLLMTLFRTILIFMFISLCCWIMASRYLDVPLHDWFVSEKTSFSVLMETHKFIYAWVSFKHPTYLSFIYLFTLGTGFYLRYKKAEIRPSAFELTLFSIASFILIIVSQSRIGFTCCAVLVLFAIIWLLRKRKTLLIVSGLAILISTVVLINAFSDKFEGIYSLDSRMQMYETAVHCIKEKPLTGCGIGGMQTILNSQEQAQELGYEIALSGNHRHPHNQFLGDFFQTGIIGFLLILFISGYIIIFSYRTKKWLLLYFFMLFLCVMMIETPLNYYKGISLMITFCCLLGKSFKQKNY